QTSPPSPHRSISTRKVTSPPSRHSLNCFPGSISVIRHVIQITGPSCACCTAPVHSLQTTDPQCVKTQVRVDLMDLQHRPRQEATDAPPTRVSRASSASPPSPPPPTFQFPFPPIV